MILINKHLNDGRVEHIAVFDCAGVRYQDGRRDMTIERVRGTSIAVIPMEPAKQVFQKICEAQFHPERTVDIHASEMYAFEYLDCADDGE